MTPTSALAHEFSRNARVRGEDYAVSDRVRHLARTASGVTATVRGTQHYDVTITPAPAGDEGVGFVVGCTCPFFEDNRAACKHIWATLRAAEGRGLLDEVPPDTNAYIVIQDRGRAVPGRPARTPRSAADEFMSRLDEGLQQIAVDQPPLFRYASGELLYVLEPLGPQVPGFLLSTCWRTRKKTGEWGLPKPAPVTTADLEVAPEADRGILVTLLGARQEYGGWSGYGSYLSGSVTFSLNRHVAAQVLPLAAQSGRLVVRHTGSQDVFPVAWDPGEPWRFVLDVAATESGYRMSGSFARGEERIPLADVSMLISDALLIAHNALIPVSLPRTEDALFVGTLARGGPIEIDRKDESRLAGALARAGMSGDFLPPALRYAEVDTEPLLRLRLRKEHRYGINPRLEADLEFDYDGIVVPDDGRPLHTDESMRRLVRRRAEVERAAAPRLASAGFRVSFDHRMRRNTTWIAPQNLSRAVRQLAAEGWRVEAEGSVWRMPGQVRMSVSSGIDWFDLDATVEYDGVAVDLPRALAALHRGDQFVRLDDGSVGMLPEDWLQRYASLAATASVEDGRLRFRPSQAVLLDALLAAQGAGAVVSLDAGFERVRDELTRFNRISPADPVASFKGALRPYQRDALGWFQFLRRFGFGGCLADDMGLGKTVMVLALLAWRREEVLRTGEGPRASAVVVPRSLVANWMSEAATFAPDLKVVDYSSVGRGHHAEAMADADVLLMTYGTLRKDVVSLKDAEFEYVILDEATAIKNAASVSAKAVRLLRGRHRLALSGTPIENHLGELWSLFEFLNPGLLGSSSFFQRTTARSQPEPETMAVLSRGLRPFFLRRTKAQVAPELPPRNEQTIYCELDKSGRAIYEGLRRHYRETLMRRIDRVGLAKSGIHVLEALLRLRQAACHPALLDPSHKAAASAKFEILLPRLRDAVAEGHKVLVFSQFTTLLGLLRQVLDEEGLPYEYLDGKTRNRAERVERFQTDPELRLFLISLKAGGQGLNLTEAEYVFLLDPWWNPAVEAQAIDRAHRIGQRREVFACRIIVRDTVEEKVLELQRSKRDLADAVLQESAVGLRHLKREDVEMLLS